MTEQTHRYCYTVDRMESEYEFLSRYGCQQISRNIQEKFHRATVNFILVF